MSDHYPPPDPNWGGTPPQNPGPGVPSQPVWGAPQEPAPQPPQQPQSPPQQPSQPGVWGAPQQPPAAPPPQWGAPQTPPSQPAWGAPQTPSQPAWGAPQPPAQEPGWAPPPPPAPGGQPQQPAWGAPQTGQGQPGAWPGAAPQQQWGQPAYGAPGYGAYPPAAPRASNRGRLWIILGSVAGAVIVVLVAGILVVPRLLDNVGPSVTPASGNTVSTSFIELKVTSSWSETSTHSTELELNNSGDGDMLVGYGNSQKDGINSDQSAFSNLQTNLRSNSGGSVSQCVSQHNVTVGGKSGLEEGFRYTYQGTSLCEIAWVDYVSSSRYYYWNIADDYAKLSTLQHDNAAMQETASWKV